MVWVGLTGDKKWDGTERRGILFNKLLYGRDIEEEVKWMKNMLYYNYWLMSHIILYRGGSQLFIFMGIITIVIIINTANSNG
jgi:hypothetical protein